MPRGYKKDGSFSGKVFKKGHLVSEETRRKISEHSFWSGKIRENSKNWHGGKIIDCYGYICIYQPEHPLCNQKGYVKEHRLIMEKYIGRYLSRKEIVHHINGNKTDNKIENLELTTNQIHSKIETKKRWENGFKRKKTIYNTGWFKKGCIPSNTLPEIEKKCLICGKVFTIRNYRKNTAKYCSIKCQHISLKRH